MSSDVKGKRDKRRSNDNSHFRALEVAATRHSRTVKFFTFIKLVLSNVAECLKKRPEVSNQAQSSEAIASVTPQELL
ncbi:hypothetical protein BVRB_4g076540 [Beta vulgaris subsp. vulgaris]|nr:hypothetical protein BVRB_4g076540 [Beta vulgaris subsp. vulgaris]